MIGLGDLIAVYAVVSVVGAVIWWRAVDPLAQFFGSVMAIIGGFGVLFLVALVLSVRAYRKRRGWAP